MRWNKRDELSLKQRNFTFQLRDVFVAVTVVVAFKLLSSVQDYVYLEDHEQPTNEITPGFKPFTKQSTANALLVNGQRSIY